MKVIYVEVTNAMHKALSHASAHDGKYKSVIVRGLINRWLRTRKHRDPSQPVHEGE